MYKVFILNILVILTICANEQRPNIVVILADDLGFSDLGSYGGEIETPVLDDLAKKGVRFTEFYSTSRCCPSRASLLTGLYPHQADIGWMVYENHGKGYGKNLGKETVTFAEALKSVGYQTMMSGKWHVGHTDKTARPERRGFDKFTGVYSHIDAYWSVLRGCEIYRNEKMLYRRGVPKNNPYDTSKEFFITDYFTDAGMEYIDEATQNKSKPFLLYMAYNAPHFPLEAPDDVIAKYRGRYMKGWDKLKEEKLERMKKLGIVDADQKQANAKAFENKVIASKGRKKFKFGVPTKDLPKWDSLSEEDKQELDFRRAMYAAQVDNMDWNIGRLVKKLKEKGVYENTLILFMSDNGCSGELGLFGLNWKRYKESNYKSWKKKGGWSISQGQAWASFSNAPFRSYKKFVHEGGVSSPLIAHWPKGIKKAGHIVKDNYFHFVDVMPTLLELAGAEYPTEYAGRKITPVAGRSMLPLIKGTKNKVEDRPVFFQHENHSAIRLGRWKLVTFNDRKDDQWELYDISKDRDESNNLISQNPEIAKKMKVMWTQWAKDVNALPFQEDRK